MGTRLNRIVPYVIVLAIVSGLFVMAGRIDFVAPGGRIGPNFWPRMILSLAMIACVYEIVKRLFFARDEQDLEGVLGSVLKSAPADMRADADDLDAPAERQYPHLLWTGIAMTVAYAVLIDKLGFFLCTLVYMAAFMWVGRYRRIGIIVTVSLLGTLAFMFMFMKVVYVSLPLGVEPFSSVSFLLMRLMGIR
jgi:putative tricarboxylic transport membrane protein